MTYDFDLATELVLSDLAPSFLVQVGSFDPRLELFNLSRLRADFLDLLLAAVVLDAHLGQLAGQLLFHADHVERTRGFEACDAVAGSGLLGADARVECCLAERH